MTGSLFFHRICLMIDGILLMAGLAFLILEREAYIREQSSFSAIRGYPEESAGFRSMVLSPQMIELLKKQCTANNMDWAEVLTVCMLDFDFAPEKSLCFDEADVWEKRIKGYKKRDEEAFQRLKKSYEAVLSDLVFFPVPVSRLDPQAEVHYENSWMFERNYGGYRGHEGTDVMPSIDMENYYPVVSMTDGTVEQVGWLKKGGYRIGIRSPHGGYFYYAHLSSYAREFHEKETIKAGQLLGYMGNTGYGEEGTKGKFDVHLHLGIYISTEHYPELSVNPYWILKYMEDYRIRYNF